MEGDDELIISGDFKSFKFSERYDLKNASKQEVTGLLVKVSNMIEPYIYEFSGIDTKKIDAMVTVGKGISSVCSFLKTFKRDSLLPACINSTRLKPSVTSGGKALVTDNAGKTTMLPIAESYLINRLLTKAGVPFKPVLNCQLKSQNYLAKEHLMFVANYAGWLAIKKLSINEKTEAWEVSGILSSINFTLINKVFDFTGASGNCSSGRKFFSNLAAELEKIDANNPYLVCKTCEGFGYKPYASPEMLMDEYPDIKPPKLKGRKAKG